MKKIIYGKKYDTETAHEVCTASNGYPRNDFGYYEETLYRKTTGEYFLYGEGGPASCYAEHVGQNEWQSGCILSPLTLQAAKEWAEVHMTGEEYEAEFGPVEDDGGKVAVTISLSASAKEKLKQMAVARRITLSAMIEEWAKTL